MQSAPSVWTPHIMGSYSIALHSIKVANLSCVILTIHTQIALIVSKLHMGCLFLLHLQMRNVKKEFMKSHQTLRASQPAHYVRGVVTGWIVIYEARTFLNSKKRCCEERECSYSGNYSKLQVHAREIHPDANPSEIDPARKLDWETFQRSSEITDVLSMIHMEVPRGVVLGDYVIEHGDDSGDEYEDFPGDEGNWWTSCVLYQVFDNLRASSIRRRPRASEWRRVRQRLAYDASNRDEGSISPPTFREY